MKSDQLIWQSWSEELHRWGMVNPVVILLELTGPIQAIGAQFIYISQPFIDWLFPENHLQELANLLEDPVLAHQFISFIKELS